MKKIAIRLLSVIFTLTMVLGCFTACDNEEKCLDLREMSVFIHFDIAYAWEIGEDGSYLMADTNVYDIEDYSNLAIWNSIKDMNRQLGLPYSLDKDMELTTWSMGRQNKVFEASGVEVTWTYHPDKGLEVTYKRIKN